MLAESEGRCRRQPKLEVSVSVASQMAESVHGGFCFQMSLVQPCSRSAATGLLHLLSSTHVEVPALSGTTAEPSFASPPSKDIILSLLSIYLPWILRHNLQPHFLKSKNRNKPTLFCNPN
ncbi:hypothetical protein RchiOBHm_Chr2g0146971 [Rosa chinensis]|uniref:Uncharacterized protein n=1 Tax=Rosa chinensis TaxID=74649 RepID=A0A2P6RZ12_ROSCH|nr:hypothetical protein RchiOBHm_Chr2g0146971 [Rosa chinensis]